MNKTVVFQFLGDPEKYHQFMAAVERRDSAERDRLRAELIAPYEGWSVAAMQMLYRSGRDNIQHAILSLAISDAMEQEGPPAKF